MTIENFEATMIKDAIVEYWHSNMKHSQNEIIKEKYRCLMVDFKTIQQSKGKTFTIKIK